jgi:CHAT domain-containing protein
MKFLIKKLLLIMAVLAIPLMGVAQNVDKGFEYFDTRQYEKAAIEFENCIPDFKKKYGEKDTANFSILLLYTALSFDKAMNAKKAESYYIQCNKVYKNAKAIHSLKYATSCTYMALFYQSLGYYQKALPLCIEAKKIREKALGIDHPDFAQSCNNLALSYQLMGDYQKALSLYLEAKQITEKVLGKEHYLYATSCNNLAELYRDLGDYLKALPLFIEAKQIREKVLGLDHPLYATSCNGLAGLYKSMGDYQKALPLYIEARQITEKASGRENPDYATSCNNLALLYKLSGDYQKALPLYVESKQITEKVFGKEHPDYVVSCNNLALLYQLMGNYQKALPLYIESKQIAENFLGKEHLDYAQSCNNLALLYQLMGNYQKALPLYLEAKQIHEKNLGKEHPDYAMSCNNLAELYHDLGDYQKAMPLYKEAKKIREKVLGKEHPDYAASCSSLAYLYQSIGDYSKALPLCIEARQTYKKALGKEHPDYALSCNNLAALYQSMGDYQKADTLIVEANLNLNNQIRQNFSFLSDKEKELFIKTISYNFDIYHSFALHYKNQKPDFTSLNYDNELAHKGMILQSSKAVQEAVIGSNKPELITIYDKITSTRSMLSRLYTLPINQRFVNTDSLENEANNLEKQMIKGVQELPGYENFSGFNVKKTWTDIQKSLKENEEAIEFSSFNYRNNKSWTDSILYCALIVRQGYNHPVMIPLFEEKQLSGLINKYKEVNKIDFNWVTGLYIDKQLYDLIWQPIDSLLHGINTIYYSPSGLLNKIAISAIPVNEKERLSDRYRFSVLGSTGELTGARNKITNFKSAAIFGGLKYDADSLDIKQAVERADDETSLITMRGKNNERWEYMESSREETNTINNLLKVNNISVKSYTYGIATEESFKNLSNYSPELIHISTHGFYNPLPEKDQRRKSEQLNNFTSRDVYNLSENPLMRTGLIFAGANYVWTGNSPVPDRDDGILTAYEISNLNLFNTKLVVTSACETALGDVQGSEGVIGLQRGFKMAGVDNLIITLWEVSAEFTKEFMISFYTKLLTGQSIHDAFYTTQAEMKVKSKNMNPYYWAAFVLLE